MGEAQLQRNWLAQDSLWKKLPRKKTKTKTAIGLTRSNYPSPPVIQVPVKQHPLHNPVPLVLHPLLHLHLRCAPGHSEPCIAPSTTPLRRGSETGWLKIEAL